MIKVISPFGPKIAKLKFSLQLINKINLEVDKINTNKKLAKKLDYSKKLVGQVKQEISLPKSFIKKNLDKIISKNIKNFINKYNKVSNYNDSAFTCIQLNEFLFDKKKSLNFNSLESAISRKKLPNIYQSTNGAYIVSSKTMEDVGSLYGKKPLKHKVTWLQSLEVKSSYELENFKFFMSKYIKQNF